MASPILHKYEPMFIEVTFSPYPFIWWSRHWTGNTKFGYNTLVNITASGSYHADVEVGLIPPSGDEAPAGDVWTGAGQRKQCDDAAVSKEKRLLERAKSHPTIGARSSVVCTGLRSGAERMTRNFCGNLEYLPLGSTGNPVENGAAATWTLYPEMEMDLASRKRAVIGQTEGGEDIITPERKVNNTTFTLWAGSLNTKTPPDPFTGFGYVQNIPPVYKNSRADEKGDYQQGHHITNIKIKYGCFTWNSNKAWEGTVDKGKKHIIQLEHVSTDVMKNDGTYQPHHCKCQIGGNGIIDITVFRFGTKTDDRPGIGAEGGRPGKITNNQLFKVMEEPGYVSSARSVERSTSFPMPAPWRVLCWENDWEPVPDKYLRMPDAEAERTYNSCAKAELTEVAYAYRENLHCDYGIDASDESTYTLNQYSGKANLTRSYVCEDTEPDDFPPDGATGETVSYTAKWGPRGQGWTDQELGFPPKGPCRHGALISHWLDDSSNPFQVGNIPFGEAWNKLNGKAFNESVQTWVTSTEAAYRWFNTRAFSETTLDVRNMLRSYKLEEGDIRPGRSGDIFQKRIQYAVSRPSHWDNNPAQVVPIQVSWHEVTATLNFWLAQEKKYPDAYHPPPSVEVAYTGAGVLDVKQRSWQYLGDEQYNSGWIDLMAPNLALVAAAITESVALAGTITVQTRVVNLTYSSIGNYCPNAPAGKNRDQSSIDDSDIETRMPDTVPNSNQAGTLTCFNTQTRELPYDHIPEYYTDRSDKPNSDDLADTNSSFEYYSTEDSVTDFPPQNPGETYESYRDTDGAVPDSSKTLKPTLPV